jgi:hypothetical protein
MSKITVTEQEVKDNMKDVLCRTEVEFGKPVTYVTVRMKNGFTLRESTTCVDPANYDENVGKQICLEKIEDKVWMLLGYALQDKIANEKSELVNRLIQEYTELKERHDKLQEFLSHNDVNAVGRTQYDLLVQQYAYMSNYLSVLEVRISDLTK